MSVQTVLRPSELGQPMTATNTTSVGNAALIAHATPSVRTVAPTCSASSDVDRSAETSEHPLLVSPVQRRSNREPAIPISEGRYKITFTAGQRVRDLLQEPKICFAISCPTATSISSLNARWCCLCLNARSSSTRKPTSRAVRRNQQRRKLRTHLRRRSGTHDTFLP